jgi:hypothetical protein
MDKTTATLPESTFGPKAEHEAVEAKQKKNGNHNRQKHIKSEVACMYEKNT